MWALASAKSDLSTLAPLDSEDFLWGKGVLDIYEEQECNGKPTKTTQPVIDLTRSKTPLGQNPTTNLQMPGTKVFVQVLIFPATV